MSITRMPTLFCDFTDQADGGPAPTCGQWADVSGWDAAEIRKNAKAAGWTRADGKDFCPEHRTTKPKGTTT